MIGRQKRRNNIKRVAVGSAMAAAAGYVAGVLTAPKSGKQTRKDIKLAAHKSWSEAEKDLKNLNTELGKMINEAKSGSGNLSSKAQKELNSLMDHAKDTKEKVREMISAVHEGEAEDKDLDKAIEDATTAINHLRNFLKK